MKMNTIQFVIVLELPPSTLERVEARDVLNAFPSGTKMYRAEDLTDQAIQVAIEDHLENVPLNESVALFGGVTIVSESMPILVPQCCSTLSEIDWWMQVFEARNDSYMLVRARNGHPYPRVSFLGHHVEIRCEDEWETFAQPAPERFAMNVSDMQFALLRLREDRIRFCTRIDGIASRLGLGKASDVLVYGCNE
jgi:hypothetical protein